MRDDALHVACLIAFHRQRIPIPKHAGGHDARTCLTGVHIASVVFSLHSHRCTVQCSWHICGRARNFFRNDLSGSLPAAVSAHAVDHRGKIIADHDAVFVHRFVVETGVRRCGDRQSARGCPFPGTASRLPQNDRLHNCNCTSEGSAVNFRNVTLRPIRFLRVAPSAVEGRQAQSEARGLVYTERNRSAPACFTAVSSPPAPSSDSRRPRGCTLL